MYIYGFHSIEAAILNAPESINYVLINSSRHDKRQNHLLELIKIHNIEVNHVNNLDELVGTNKHQGVVAVINPKNTKLEFKDLIKDLDTKDNAIILILDGITDVHNFGAIIRSADCFGVQAIIIPKNNSASTSNPIIAKTSSGAINKLPIITVNNLSRAIEQLKEHGFWIAGTALTENSINLFEFKCNKKIVWVMGSEGTGMRRLISENCDYLVTIPMQGVTKSLNVSVATGVVLAYTRFSNIQQ
ncbi:MAG: rRNA ((2251)-2-O)-methyltransferase RlmB [Burkholderiales bacterium]|jgi:23S rRNA (guanosine2251-2'-O)-methyltransferase|nr:rRNA ((2251)-2-O)-methyltransferase RlmB [Burkholderiales bacterium]MCE3267874.1 rRNA ((2251)-2-O)-methyltransferase RlmB [Burkholderiales bacterium]